jgi:hypothetical protein
MFSAFSVSPEPRRTLLFGESPLVLHQIPLTRGKVLNELANDKTGKSIEQQKPQE